MSDALLVNPRVRIWKADRRDRDDFKAQAENGRAVRLYTVRVDPRPNGDPRFALQVRGPIGLGSGGLAGDGVDFIVAHAELDLAGLRALRSAIDRQIAEGGGA